MLGFAALVIYGVFWLARRPDDPSWRREPEPAEEILKRRVAAGEISVEEYERLRDALAGEPQARARAPVS